MEHHRNAIASVRTLPRMDMSVTSELHHKHRRCHAAQVKQHAYENMDGPKKREEVKDQLAKVKALCFI